MGERKSPRVIRADYEISLVQIPPPGPPEYELVDAWIPRTPRSMEYSRRNKVPAVIATISLVIAIISFMISMKLLPIPFLSTSTYVSTTTFTTTLTTTITDIPECQVLKSYNLRIRIENITFIPCNQTHRFLNLSINVISPNIDSLRIDEKNFTVEYKKPGENLPTNASFISFNKKTKEGSEGLYINISYLIPSLNEQYIVYIYYSYSLNGNVGRCIIAMLYLMG